MFFDKSFVQNAVFRKTWLAGHNISTTRKVPMSKITKSIDKNLSRLSLKSNAVLINGAVKIYKEELDQLLKDAAELDQEMQRSRVRKNVGSGYRSSSSSSTQQSPSRSISSSLSLATTEKRASDTEGSPLFCVGRRTSIFSIGRCDDDDYEKTTVTDDSENTDEKHSETDDDDDDHHSSCGENSSSEDSGDDSYRYKLFADNGKTDTHHYEPELSTISEEITLSSSSNKRSHPKSSDEYNNSTIESRGKRARLNGD